MYRCSTDRELVGRLVRFFALALELPLALALALAAGVGFLGPPGAS